MKTRAPATTRAKTATARKPAAATGQVVLVLQGGGALGAYQVGVYRALHEAGIEPDWVIGTSIGAINGALIAGNRAEDRLRRLHEFWDGVDQATPVEAQGIATFFEPNVAAWQGLQATLGVEAASYYSTVPLYKTLSALVDFKRLDAGATRLTVGAVNVKSGQMHYFDSRDVRLSIAHIMASSALPPAFPAVRVDGEPYWDGGVYSNTPLEAVLDDRRRRDSLIFAVNVWQPEGPEPESIWQVMGRMKDIQYSSRADSHIVRQQQIHHLRHVIRELSLRLPASRQGEADVQELASWGCGTTMHVVRLLAPRLDGEDHTKDIDFTAAGIHARLEAGYADTLRVIERAPWEAPTDPIEGVIVHDAHT